MTATKLKSQREDGLGHWPAGKRRNPDALIGGQRVDEICAAALAWCREHYGAQADLARHLGVAKKTAGVWLRLDKRPTKHRAAQIQRWLNRVKKME